MKFTLPAILALAGLAAADKCDKYISDIPSCAISPIEKCAAKSGCSGTDLKCACMNEAAIKKCSTRGVKKACNKSQQKMTLAAVKKICTCEDGM